MSDLSSEEAERLAAILDTWGTDNHPEPPPISELRTETQIGIDANAVAQEVGLLQVEVRDLRARNGHLMGQISALSERYQQNLDMTDRVMGLTADEANLRAEFANREVAAYKWRAELLGKLHIGQAHGVFSRMRATRDVQEIMELSFGEQIPIPPVDVERLAVQDSMVVKIINDVKMLERYLEEESPTKE